MRLALLLAAAGAAGAGPQTVVVPHADPIPDHYIVTLSAAAAGPGGSAVSGVAGSDFYPHAVQGFAVRVTREQADSLACDSRVAAVEQDGGSTRATFSRRPPGGWTASTSACFP